MNIAQNKQFSDDSTDKHMLELRLYVDAQATGMTFRKGLIGKSLNSVCAESVEFKFYAQPLGNCRITRDNPFLEDVDAQHLDANGIVSPGTVVKENMVAISAVSPLSAATVARNENRLLAAILGDDDEQEVRDSSEYFPPIHADYVVTSVKRENIRDRIKGFEPGLIDRVTIFLERHDPLCIGDIVEVAGHSIAVVHFRDDELMPTDDSHQHVDAICPKLDASMVEGSIQCAQVGRGVSSVRDTVQARNVGPYSLITLMPLRGRKARGGQEVTALEIGWLLEHRFVAIASELTSLKCDDTFNRQKLTDLAEGRGDFPLKTKWGGPESLFTATEYARLLGLAVDCQSRNNCAAWSIAPADKDWLLRTAPLKIMRPETINYRSYKPVKGGLFCEETFGPESSARRQQAAHIELATGVVPIVYRIGDQPILSQLLGLDSEVVESLVAGRSGLNQKSEIVPSDDPSCIIKGAAAIEQLLGCCRQKPPFDLTSLVQRHVYVIPPDYRPLVLLDSGNFATSDLNDHYRRVINRNNRLGKLCELNAPQVIIDNEMRELQMCVDQLHANEWTPNPVLGSSNKPLKSGLDLYLAQTYGAPKRVDWSASARAIIDEEVPQGQCSLPATIFDCLHCKSDQPVLISAGQSFIACLPIRSDELAIRLPSKTALNLNISQYGKCIIHRPITSEAITEARRLMSMSDVPNTISVPAFDKNGQLHLLLDRILTGDPLVMDSPHLFLLGGSGSLLRQPDANQPLRTQDDVRTVTKPTVPSPSLSELLELAESTERISHVLRFEATDIEPPPHQGRVGGRPWLPSSVQWPRTSKGNPVPFFAQLPISPSLNDSIPFSVEKEMLVTLFWSDDWWEAESTSAPYVVLHEIDNLQVRELPEELQPRPLLRLERQIKKHLPGWHEICRAMRHHFDCQVPEDLLKQLQMDLDFDNRQVAEESRIGGYGFWIQDSFDDLIAQFVWNEECGFEFGDGGSLFISGSSPSELIAFVQSH